MLNQTRVSPKGLKLPTQMVRNFPVEASNDRSAEDQQEEKPKIQYAAHLHCAAQTGMPSSVMRHAFLYTSDGLKNPAVILVWDIYATPEKKNVT